MCPWRNCGVFNSNNALNALAKDFTEVVNMPESRWVAGYRAVLRSYCSTAIARARWENVKMASARVIEADAFHHDSRK